MSTDTGAKRTTGVSVCFVCLGNICRSPTAEGVFRHLVAAAGLGDAFAIESAGTAGYHTGAHPDRRSAAAAQARGIALLSRARRFEDADFERFDYILAMDRQNLAELTHRAATPEARGKVRLLRMFDPQASPDAEVPDPYYGGADGFEVVLDICQRACEGFLTYARKHHGL